MSGENIIPDGTTDFSGGMNASLNPGSIAANQYFLGVNVSCQKTSLTPRWGHIQKKLDFSGVGNFKQSKGSEVPFEQVFYGGKFQALIPYSIGPDHFVIYVVSGFIFLISTLDYTVSLLNASDMLNPYADRINWSNAGRFLVIFDFPNNPFILEGIQIHRADPAKYEVPTSVLGAYNQNRLCIANAGIDWTASDPSGSQATPDAPVTFEEIILPSTGFTGDVYQVPTANKNNDVITAMGFLQVLDTSTGIGPLLVATQNALYSYRTDLPRTLWQGGSTSLVFGSSLLASSGIVGQRAHVNVGSDLIFISNDGQVRALSMARNEQRLWGNSPISREVEVFLQGTDPSLDYVRVCAQYRNKIFATCNPYRVDCTSAEGTPQTDYVNAGVTVIELDNTASISQQSSPVWAGIWTGIRYMDFCTSDRTFYSAAKFRGRNELFAIDPSRTYDVIDGAVKPIQSVIDTKQYTNSTQTRAADGSVTSHDQTENKAIHSVDLGLIELEEDVQVNVSYKPSTVKNYYFWRDLEFCAPVEQCEALPLFPNGLNAQGIRDLNLGGVDEECNEPEQNFLYVYKGVQLRIVITGKHWELTYVKLKGKLIPQTETDPYCEDAVCTPSPAKCFSVWDIPDKGNC